MAGGEPTRGARGARGGRAGAAGRTAAQPARRGPRAAAEAEAAGRAETWAARGLEALGPAAGAAVPGGVRGAARVVLERDPPPTR